MKSVVFTFIIMLALANSTQAAWLLWKHSVTISRVEGVPRDIGPQGTVDKWELLNAVEGRKECLAALRDEFKKSHEGLLAAYPNTRISQSPVANGVTASLSTGAETSRGTSGKPVQLYFEYVFWCLPSDVNPRMTSMTTDKN
jgi:hypothetical protein